MSRPPTPGKLFNLRGARELVVSKLHGCLWLPLVLVDLVIEYAATNSPVFFGVGKDQKFVCYHCDLESGTWSFCGFACRKFWRVAQWEWELFLNTGKIWQEVVGKDFLEEEQRHGGNMEAMEIMPCLSFRNQVFLLLPESKIPICYDLKTAKTTKMEVRFAVQCLLPTASHLYVIEEKNSLGDGCRFETFEFSSGRWKEGPQLYSLNYELLLSCDGYLAVFFECDASDRGEYNLTLDLSKPDAWVERYCPYDFCFPVRAVVCGSSIYFHGNTTRQEAKTARTKKAQKKEPRCKFHQYRIRENSWSSLIGIPEEFQVSHGLNFCDFESLERLFDETPDSV